MIPSTAIALDPAPPDAVSRVAFSPNSEQLLCATWAGSLSLHSSHTGLLSHDAKPAGAALLDAAWLHASNTQMAAGCLDGRLILAELANATIAPWQVIGKHDDAVRAVVPLETCLVSGSWDSTVRMWDTRVDKGARQTSKVDAGGKIYGMSSCGSDSVVFINSERHVRVLDCRKTDSFVHDKIPPTLTYQLRGVSASADGRQYVVGSTEGRVAVEWLNDAKRESFSFKCHRLDGLAFPVNTIAHNAKYGSFATGGGDGHVSFWDGEARKRIAQYARYPTSVASIDFDSKSEKLAVAVSYTFEEGEKDHPPDEVHIRNVEDAHIATREALQRDEISAIKIHSAANPPAS